MTVRATPASIGNLASNLATSTEENASPPPPVDAGASTSAVQAALAELLRARSGLIETVGRTAADLEENKATYATTDAANADLFRPAGR